MKRLKIVLVTVFALVALSTSAQKAIGLRFAGGNSNGAEITYQMPIGGETNRLQLDLGGSFDSDGGTDYSVLSLTGTYQWMWDIPSVDGLAWYAGPGASVGIWMLDFDKSINDMGIDDESGLNLAIGGIVGIEYTFADFPIQLSLDTRPMWNLSGADDYGSNLGLSLAARYIF